MKEKLKGPMHVFAIATMQRPFHDEVKRSNDTGTEDVRDA